jgi:hypothetical protein
MNPLLMPSVRSATFQDYSPGDSPTVMDHNGFPVEIIHDVKVIVETFRVLIRAEWEYKVDNSQKVHWIPPLTSSKSSSSPSVDADQAKVEYQAVNNVST